MFENVSYIENAIVLKQTMRCEHVLCMSAIHRFLIHMSISKSLRMCWIPFSISQIPLTWTHTVAPYQPPYRDMCIYTEDPVSYDFTSFGRRFNAMFVNTPINYDCSNFTRLNISRRLIPTGFVFVWADKENIPAIIDIFETKGFYYVENLVWVQERDEDTTKMNEVVQWRIDELERLHVTQTKQAYVVDSPKR